MHVAKYQRGHATRIMAHVKRERETVTESKIDWTKTKDNVDLVECMSAEEFGRIQGLAKRKDAVVLVDSVLTLPEELKYSSRHTQIAFFRCALDAMEKHIGGKTAFASIHFDETTPHLHHGIVPITEDGRLCAKEVVNRSMLKGLHGKVEEAVRSKGYNVRLQEENEEMRQAQHDMGYSKKSMREYRKDATVSSMEAQYDRETEKTIEYHQKAMEHGKKSVKRRKGESKEDYKERRKEMIQVPKSHYDALMALDFDRETVQKGAEAEYALKESKALESTITDELRLIQTYGRQEKQKLDRRQTELDAEVEARATEKALEYRKDRLDDLEAYCKGLKMDNGKSVLENFEIKREAEKVRQIEQMKQKVAPNRAKTRYDDWER